MYDASLLYIYCVCYLKIISKYYYIYCLHICLIIYIYISRHTICNMYIIIYFLIIMYNYI